MSGPTGMSEGDWEALVMDTLGELAWLPMEGKRIASGSGERESWGELIIPGRLRAAIERINPQLNAYVDLRSGLLQDQARLTGESAAGIGQLHPALGSVKQLAAQLLLELADLLAERRLGDMSLLQVKAELDRAIAARVGHADW